MITITRKPSSDEPMFGMLAFVQKNKPALGRKLKDSDRLRIALALEILAYGKAHPFAAVGKYTALKIATVIYPRGLRDDLPEALHKVPLPVKPGQFRTDKFLSPKKREKWERELNRLKKALHSHKDQYVTASMPRPMKKGDWRSRSTLRFFSQAPAESWLAKIGKHPT